MLIVWICSHGAMSKQPIWPWFTTYYTASAHAGHAAPVGVNGRVRDGFAFVRMAGSRRLLLKTRQKNSLTNGTRVGIIHSSVLIYGAGDNSDQTTPGDGGEQCNSERQPRPLKCCER